MPSHFNFSSYHTPPSGWQVLEASKHSLRLYHKSEKRQYIVTCPAPAKFEVRYMSDIQTTPQFVFSSDSFQRILQLMGCLHANRVG